MGRASFGGSGDYSGLFASLYQGLGDAEGGTGTSTAAQAAKLRYQFESGQLDAQGYADALRALAATGDQTSTSHFNLLTTAENALQSAASEAKSKAAEIQAAADQTAADQWSNGVMADDDWLAYIRRRAAAATDPQEKAKWAGYDLQYSGQIGDNRAESAYKEGGSINDLVLYYQTKLGSTAKDTQDYRDAQLRLNDLQDQRSATSVQDGADAINEQIKRGKSTYQDLAKFYQQQLRSLRPGSQLKSQIEGEITKVKDAIFQNDQAGKLEKLQYDYERGHITGRTFAAGIRATAAMFQKTDPQKYYQMLESATKLDKNPGFIGAAAAAAKARAAKNKKLAEHVDTLQAQRNNLLSLVAQHDAGQKTGYDAISGKTVTFTPDLVRSLDMQILKTYEGLAAAHDAKGDHSAAQGDWAARNKYIVDGGDNTLGVIGHNTENMQDSYANLVLGSVKVLQANAESPNPDPAIVAKVATNWGKFAKKLTSTGGINAQTGFDTSQARSALNSFDPQFIARTQAITDALTTAGNPLATQAEQETARASLSVAFGADEGFPDAPATRQFKQIADNLIAPAALATSVHTGLVDRSVMRLAVDGKVTYVNVRPQSPTDMAEGMRPQPDYKLKDNQKIVQAVIDIDGRPTVVNTVATLTSSNLTTWQAAKAVKAVGIKQGDLLDDGQIAKLDQQFPGWRDTDVVDRVAIYDYYEYQTPEWIDQQGRMHPPQVWVQDPKTGQSYRDHLPIRVPVPRADGTITAINNQVAIDHQAFADAAGVPAAYSGQHQEKVGALIGSPDGIDVTGLRGRDINGAVTDKLSADPAFAYFDPTQDGSPADRQAEKDWYNQNARKNRMQAARDRALADQRKLALDEATKAGTIKQDTAAMVGGAAATFDKAGLGGLSDALMAFGRTIGLNLGPAGAKPSTPAVASPAPQGASAGKTIHDLQMPTVKGPTYGGPVIKTVLPAVGFTKIDVPVITMPKTTASQVTAAATAAAKAAAAKMPTVTIPKTVREHGAAQY